MCSWRQEAIVPSSFKPDRQYRLRRTIDLFLYDFWICLLIQLVKAKELASSKLNEFNCIYNVIVSNSRRLDRLAFSSQEVLSNLSGCSSCTSRVVKGQVCILLIHQSLLPGKEPRNFNSDFRKSTVAASNLSNHDPFYNFQLANFYKHLGKICIQSSDQNIEWRPS